MPLCFDCHADVQTYNPHHPRGTKYTVKELKQHRDRLFRHIARGGPLVLDLITRESVAVLDTTFPTNAPLVKIKRIDLEHEARVARYRTYIRAAEEFWRKRQFAEAIRYFETAFELAESDEKLEDYIRGGNYYRRKIFLWQCYLEEIANTKNRECLRAVVNMKIEENAIKEIHEQDRASGGLTCAHYFYLLLQEGLFLDYEEICSRSGSQFHIKRARQFMNLIEDPHCPERMEELVLRAQKLIREIEEKTEGIRA